jgi:hypothetical protein
MQFWRANELYPNQTMFLVGGGPSLKGMDLSALAGQYTIAVNNAFRLVPNPDVIFYADTRWWSWNGKDIPAEFPGRIISTCSAGARYLDPRVCRMGRCYRFTEEDGAGLSHDPTLLSGPDSGYMAINLAYLLGASRIVLLGYDMGFTAGESHWHEDHPIETPESNYLNLFAPTYPKLIGALQKAGVEVVRCTPSRLDFIPQITLEEALALPQRRRG